MAHVNRRIGKSSETANNTADGTGGGVLDAFIHDYFNRSGNVPSSPGIDPSGMSASGGVVNDYTVSSTVYRAHIFTGSGTFVVNSLATGDFPNNVEYLVVGGGGGGGGSAQSGGGGAGGFRTNLTGHPQKAADYAVSVGTYTVTVGAGGRGSTESYPHKQATSGGNSEFYPTPASYPSTARVRSDGGGGGKGYGASPNDGTPGGSGGGAFNESGGSPTAGASITDPNHPQPQGNVGGISPEYVAPYAGGGGGGAGRAGAPDSPSTPLGRSTGGYGLQCLIAGPPTVPQPVGAPGPGSGAAATGYFAGGGAGGYWPGNPPGNHTAGYGGGGAVAFPGPSHGGAGALTSGGGGSGASGTGPETPRKSGGNGGSGVVVVRYVIGTLKTAKATGGNISFYGGKTIHTFLGSGTFATTSDWDNPAIEYVIVGGGGGGGGNNLPGASGGGGGAGGYLTGSVTLGTHPNSTTITIAGGGLGGQAIDQNPGKPVALSTPGGDTTAAFPPGSKVAGGGGRGGGGPSHPGGSVVYYTAERGASGGGGNGYTNGNANVGADGNYYPPASPLHPAPAPGQGNDGGSSPGGSPYSGAVGGGSGAVGESNSAPVGGHGGKGTQLPTTFRDPNSGVGYPGPGSTKYWVAGGGGGGRSPSGAGGVGGAWDGSALLPGGPHAGASPGASATPATTNSGSGGGGGGSPERVGSNGGSGIVLIAYPT